MTLKATPAVDDSKCIWCGMTGATDDHVFPRALGGTRELAVPACNRCQQEISKAEGEVARRSIFALHRFDKGPTPRKKNRPDSGIVAAKYIFVKSKHLGGYAEIGLRSGHPPIMLPCIEIDIDGLNCRKRGTKPEDINRLVEAVLSVVAGPSDEKGLLGYVDVDLLSETEAQFADDPDWWPRIILDLRGNLKVRARSGQEAEQFFRNLFYLAERGVFSDHSGWSKGEILAGTPHRALLQCDATAEARVVAKIAIAIAVLKSPQVLTSALFAEISLFIRGKQDSFSERVRQVKDAGSITEWPDHHLALIQSQNNKIQAVVILSGACFIIDLGENPWSEVFSNPSVAISHRNGISTFFVSDNETAKIAEKLLPYLVSNLDNA